MGRQRRTPRHTDGGAFPIQYLLPAQSPFVHEDEDGMISSVPEGDEDEHRDELDELSLYRQAVPLLHPQSTSAARTIGKMLGDHKLAARMLQRSQAVSKGSNTHPPALNALRHLDFLRACEDLFFGFDPATKRTNRFPLHRIRLLLHHYGLQVDDVAYRQWEHSLPANCSDVSLVMFIDACTKWFHEQVLIDKLKALRPGGLLEKCQSAPQLLHPFDALTRQQDEAAAFSYEDCVRSPQCQRKTQDERCANKSQAMISATQQLRRQTKMLTRPTAAPTDSLSPMVATHDRLHEEKLARHILQRCGSQALAPSNRRKSSASIGMGNLSTTNARSPNSHADQLKEQRMKKLVRQQNTETAKAFSASIAMISRHVHNEELRDLREIAYEKQLAMVDERKQLRRLQYAHCQALAQEKSQQQMRDVMAMKTLAQEEGEMARQYLESREAQLRIQKPQFTLSSSTSTLFQQPPEILAAKATVKTGAQKKRLQLMEKEHLDHMRSIQLLDYAYEKRRAIEDANEPKSDAALVDLQVENLPDAQETVLATEELWQQIVETCKENHDLTPLIPPPNSPPAALRYFASTRPMGSLPPFTASTVTPTPLSKVP